MEKNSEKIIARLFLLGNTISNTTEYDIDFVSDGKIDISDILDIDIKIKLRDENSTSKREI